MTAGQDRPALKAVPSLPAAAPIGSLQVKVDPLPNYDGKLRPWWVVRIHSGNTRYLLSWSSVEGRFADGSQLRRFERQGRTRILADVEEACRAAVGPKRDERTDIAKSILEIAKRVLENVALGRIYPQGTIEWAEQIVRGNRGQRE